MLRTGREGLIAKNNELRQFEASSRARGLMGRRPDVSKMEVGFLQDPQGLHAVNTTMDLESAAHKIGVRIIVVPASVENDLDAAFAKLVSAGAQGLIINADAIFFGWQNRLVMLTARHAIPTISIAHVYARAGLLMSYGTSDISELYRQAAAYVARVLKGEKPGDLPVQGPTKFELVVNLKTAKALGLAVPEHVARSAPTR